MSFTYDTLKQALSHPGVILPGFAAVGAGIGAHVLTAQKTAMEALCTTIKTSRQGVWHSYTMVSKFGQSGQVQEALNTALAANNSALECTKSTLSLVSAANIVQNIAIGAAAVGACYLAYRTYKILTEPPSPPPLTPLLPLPLQPPKDSTR